MKASELFKKKKPAPEFTGAPGVFWPSLHPLRDEVKRDWAGQPFSTDDVIGEVCRRLRATRPMQEPPELF